MSLKLIKSFKEQKIIEKPEEYIFPVQKTGIYFVEITARAKSWWQKYFRNFFSDDELQVEIDGLNYYDKLGKSQRNASKFNGNNIKNLQKTIIYIVYLEKKGTDCNIRLIPKHKPTLEQINIYQVTDNKVVYEPTINNPAEDDNLKALINPIETTNNPNDHQKWKETYDLAEKVIKGEIPDPTDGANHYYDDSIGSPSWAKNIKPKLEIENLNFFYVK